MNKQKLSLLIPFIFILSCVKEDYSDMPIYLPGDTTYGFVSIRKNTKEMKAGANAVHCHRNDDEVTLIFGTLDSLGFLAEYFAIQCIELNLEKQKLCSSRDPICLSSITYATMIDDQLEDRYNLRTNANNFVRILEINSISGYMKGKMEMHFERDTSRPKQNENNPEKVSFTDGVFEVRLPE